jgi:TRAP-type C4-dicarboxylate transport system permease small subunit
VNHLNIIFERVEKVNHVLKNIGMFIGGVSILFMMLLIVTDVFMRNVLNSPITGTYEIVQYFLMPLAIFPTIAYTYNSGVLPKLSELIEKTSKRYQTFTKYLITMIEVILFSLLTIYGWKFAMSGVSDQMAIPVSGNLIPVYPIYFLVPFGFGIVILEIILSTIKPLIQERNK